MCTVAALCVIVIDHYHRVADGPLWLAVATLLLGVVRTVDSARLAEAERLAMTDELTRVGNRRRLFRDLGAALERGEALRLALFDLNGFKAHNDTFGHVSGDELLASLGARLNSAVEGAGGAYRLGGDEFCVLLSADVEGAFERAHAALHDDGISASSGSVLLPRRGSRPDAGLAHRGRAHVRGQARRHLERDRLALMPDGDWRDGGFRQRRPSAETLAWVAASMGRDSRIVGYRRLTGGVCSAVHRLTVERRGPRTFVVLRQYPGGLGLHESPGERDRQPRCGGRKRAPGSEHPGC